MSNQIWKVYDAPPSASSMIESLRGLGYSPATALADLIDNSIAAGASKVDLTFCWKGDQRYITVQDDGCGMTDEELFSAMRLGHLDPLGERSKRDLGRFGLGLKTASFSQCRSLTVLSKKKGHASCSLRWDLDYLAADTQSRWQILEEPGKDAATLRPAFEEIEQGTLVVWEKLDRIITSGFSIDDFLELTDVVESHLALTFHRFLQGTRPELVLTINGRRIRARDPFMQEHPATMSTTEDFLQTGGGRICLQGFVLPHKDMLSSQDVNEMGDPANWTESQGFYVYRNRRLLVAGSWLGLGKGGRSWSKEEAYRLARIRLDIPNTADSDWKLDIRKSRASPPASIKKRLLLLAEDVRDKARHVFAYRGAYKKRTSAGGEVENIWEVCHGRNDVRYHISRKHPAVEALLAGDPEIGKAVESLLVLIENTVPVQRIWLDAAEGRDAPRRIDDATPSDVMQEILLTVYKNRIRHGNCTPQEVRRQLLLAEPFSEFPELVESLPDMI
ncbi:MAG TPA: ATP-binding protein [Candidatus Desulfovibrio intestinipullorum]|uniref:ATP-binding protein n=1 Tax=Candidatus Desulfovibrio intestinipullorum TaxID=2838536 RepID=A0A9D1PWP2_9BACT|nr:ATP-binding protein [Candidatus Desulfovibrio intestinipullorum]